MMRERRRLPFPLVPFPVEVGSGFMADVELASEELGIPLLVPPPRRPQFSGCLAHGSIVAREYGIPAVLGVGDATQRIKSGQKIAIDGDRGLATLLDDA